MGVNQMALKWDLLKINKQELPQITPLQMAENGEIDIEKSLALAMAQPKSLKEKLGGRTVSIDTETLNPETNEMEINRVSKYQPGLLEDIRSGAKENFATGFAAPNWEQTVTPDGRKKGLGYRFGEGLGSFARFANSPLGRGLLMAGIVGATGGTALPAMAFGAQAGFGNKQVRMKDQLYRNALANRKIDTSDIGGFIGDDTFKYLLEDQQLRDNAEYRKLYYDMQQQNQKDLMEFRRWQAEKDVEQNKIDNYYKGQQIAQGWQRIKADQEQNENNKDIQALNEMEAQLDDFVSTFDVVDNPYRYRIAGGVSNALNTLTPEEANFNAKRTLLFNAIARKLAGEKGVLSDQDIKRIDDALPRLSDNKKQKMAKMDATYSLLDIRRGYKTPQAQAGNTTKSGVKYEVID
jgi:hypothetical protein